MRVDCVVVADVWSCVVAVGAGGLIVWWWRQRSDETQERLAAALGNQECLRNARALGKSARISFGGTCSKGSHTVEGGGSDSEEVCGVRQR